MMSLGFSIHFICTMTDVSLQIRASHANEQLRWSLLEVMFAVVQKQLLMSELKHVYEEHLLHHCLFNVFRTSKTV